MSARQDADLDGDLAYIFEAAAVHAHTLFDDPLADAVLELFVEELAQDVGVVGESLPELGDHLFAQLVSARLASGFVSTEGGAVEAPLMLRIVGSFSWSTDRTVETTCMSRRKPSGKSGRSGRSVSLEARMAVSLGRPSRRMNAPGILPAA